MNLKKLFEMQKVLDQKIYDRFPGLKEEPWDWKILALLTELGECANEWRGFKKWSKDQRPRTEIFVGCKVCNGTGDENYERVQEDAEGSGGHEYIDCESCEGSGSDGPKNPLLEEYVDCLHFILSIGLDIETELEYVNITVSNADGVTHQFNDLFSSITELNYQIYLGNAEESQDVEACYLDVWAHFRSLGNMLGFTWDQVESAYFAKNEVNHVRQANGY